MMLPHHTTHPEQCQTRDCITHEFDDTWTVRHCHVDAPLRGIPSQDLALEIFEAIEEAVDKVCDKLHVPLSATL